MRKIESGKRSGSAPLTDFVSNGSQGSSFVPAPILGAVSSMSAVDGEEAKNKQTRLVIISVKSLYMTSPL
ncbi:hypothetical protein JCM9140_880 [Halalkalibacter wakoensis JCM 9140]|uniref:Uncharacterized protein n=1 Tax=Halalkalibacter wakoensis JCM 9140 TaxID=1236970 RepID=W4PYN6_9BACI|nr:hypothetical protein JCM9140_880 [Halalkalibacter wakoensis JCM 9140]